MKRAIDRRRLIVGSIFVLAAPTASRAGSIVQVSIEKMAFNPQEIAVNAGDTVEWRNKDPFAHTATVTGGWELVIPPGKTASRVMATGESADYFCRFHPNMKGRIVVR